MRRTIVLVLLLVACAPPSPPRPVTSGASRQHGGTAQIHCPRVAGVATVDPIVFHGEGVQGHQHQFFGNATLLSLPDPSSASYLQLAGQATRCENPNDTAAYWTPTLIDRTSGQVVPVQAFIAYYRDWQHNPHGDAEAPAPDTRLVAPMSADLQVNDWSCGQFELRRHPYASTLPNCTGVSGRPGHTLTAHVNFPSCWDGVMPDHSGPETGDTRDNAHWAYRTGNSCPVGFDHRMTTITLDVMWAYTGDAAANLILSSDAMYGTSLGRSLHGDFWNTWSQVGLEQMLGRCVRSNGRIFPGEC